MTSRQHNLPPPPPPEVYNYIMKELSPLKKEVFPFWQELLTMKVTIWEAIRRNKLKKYQETYDSFASRWVKAREKVIVLDKLIDPNDKEGEEKLAIIMGAGYLRQMEVHETELTRIMNDLSNTLRDKKTEADFKTAIFISTVAICIGVVSVIVSSFT